MGLFILLKCAASAVRLTIDEMNECRYTILYIASAVEKVIHFIPITTAIKTNHICLPFFSKCIVAINM
jgi:hypothetical protein